jgi:hypothetical protein
MRALCIAAFWNGKTNLYCMSTKMSLCRHAPSLKAVPTDDVLTVANIQKLTEFIL